jgi:hypothetical protein
VKSGDQRDQSVEPSLKIHLHSRDSFCFTRAISSSYCGVHHVLIQHHHLQFGTTHTPGAPKHPGIFCKIPNNSSPKGWRSRRFKVLIIATHPNLIPIDIYHGKMPGKYYEVLKTKTRGHIWICRLKIFSWFDVYKATNGIHFEIHSPIHGNLRSYNLVFRVVIKAEIAICDITLRTLCTKLTQTMFSIHLKFKHCSRTFLNINMLFLDSSREGLMPQNMLLATVSCQN